MSVNSNGTSTIAQSMNGIITVYADDITTNTLTANTLYTQVIRAPVPSSVSDVYGSEAEVRRQQLSSLYYYYDKPLALASKT